MVTIMAVNETEVSLSERLYSWYKNTIGSTLRNIAETGDEDQLILSYWSFYRLISSEVADKRLSVSQGTKLQTIAREIYIDMKRIKFGKYTKTYNTEENFFVY